MISALTEMRRQVVANRILIKPSFQDFDKSKCCHVTDQQFSRVLKKLTIMPPSDMIFELIIRKYFDKGNTKEVNYLKFCQDVDRPEDMFPGYTPKNPKVEIQIPSDNSKLKSTFFNGTTKDLNVLENRFSQQVINIANDPTDVENRLQAIVVMKRVRIEEFFRDFDKLRKGKVTIPQFKSILSIMKFQLTEEEFDSIAEKYKTIDNLFNYVDFCHTINIAFTQKGIDKNPTHTVKAVTSEDTYLARRKYLEITPEEE